jgi:ubiquinone/menaquinone biosynthesis C-methylase UbiE
MPRLHNSRLALVCEWHTISPFFHFNQMLRQIMTNRDVYQLDQIVKVYKKANDLLGPEETILNMFADKWINWRVLDIGIGTGRTTAHFAPIAKEYVGVDYAQSMVDASAEAFKHLGTNTKIQLGDVRSMPEFETGYFDFVMFSYNGLDSISHEERLQSLAEMKRVVKKGGYVFFSSHNLQYMVNMYKIRHNGSFRYFAYRCYRLLNLLYYNGLPWKYLKMDRATIRDDVHKFKMKHYYAKPAVVVQQLKDLGLKNIRVFPSKAPHELDITKLDTVDQYGWLHYLCEV